MSKTTFSLSSKVDKSTGKAQVMVTIVQSGHRLYGKTGLYVEPAKWSADKQTGKQSVIDRALIEFNKDLSDLKFVIASAMSEVSPAVALSSQWLQEVIDRHNHPELFEQTPQTLLTYVDQFIKNAERRQVNGKYIVLNTIKTYRTTRVHLIEFAAAQGVSDFEFAEIDEGFYVNFVKFLQTQGKTTNTIGKNVQLVKTIVKSAPKELRDQCDLDKFRVFKESVSNIYLNEDELTLLESADLSDAPTLDRARDFFLLLAWTGCRYSDIDKVTPASVKGGLLSMRQQKTGAEVFIPLHPAVQRIFDKYQGTMPKPICEQKFNYYIKDVCQRVGLDSTERKTRTTGGVLTTTEMSKYQMVSSHTGRRSFATNMYLRGVPTLTIMAITGHTTESNFLKYIKVTKEQHAQRMADLWRKFYN